MADYEPYTNPVALASWYTRFGDDAQANALGSSAIITGSQSSSSAQTALTSAPATGPQTSGAGSPFGSFVNGILDAFSTTTPLGQAAKAGSLLGQSGSKSPALTNFSQTIVWSVILVIIGLMLMSRGFGMIGEQGANVVLSLGDPKKYPGIGHAVQALKKRGAAAAE